MCAILVRLKHRRRKTVLSQSLAVWKTFISAAQSREQRALQLAALAGTITSRRRRTLLTDCFHNWAALSTSQPRRQRESALVFTFRLKRAWSRLCGVVRANTLKYGMAARQRDKWALRRAWKALLLHRDEALSERKRDIVARAHREHKLLALAFTEWAACARKATRMHSLQARAGIEAASEIRSEQNQSFVAVARPFGPPTDAAFDSQAVQCPEVLPLIFGLSIQDLAAWASGDGDACPDWLEAPDSESFPPYGQHSPAPEPAVDTRREFAAVAEWLSAAKDGAELEAKVARQLREEESRRWAHEAAEMRLGRRQEVNEWPLLKRQQRGNVETARLEETSQRQHEPMRAVHQREQAHVEPRQVQLEGWVRSASISPVLRAEEEMGPPSVHWADDLEDGGMSQFDEELKRLGFALDDNVALDERQDHFGEGQVIEFTEKHQCKPREQQSQRKTQLQRQPVTSRAAAQTSVDSLLLELGFVSAPAMGRTGVQQARTARSMRKNTATKLPNSPSVYRDTTSSSLRRAEVLRRSNRRRQRANC